MIHEFKVPSMRKMLIGAACGIALSLAASNVYTVQPYERAVVTSGGTFQSVAQPGMHVTIPFISNVIRYSIGTQQFHTDKLNTYTIDNQEVDAILVVNYSIPESEMEYVYRNLTGFSEASSNASGPPLLYNMVVDRWKIEAGKFNVSEIANNRATLVKNVLEIVRTDAKRLYHIDVTDVQLFNLDYQDSYRAAQAKAATVKTQIETSAGLKTQAAIDAETAKIQASGVANQAIEAARGQAESVRLNAIAQAESIKIIGEAQANAQELMAQALTKNATLVELEKAKRWNGQLPVNVYAGAPIPFLNSK